MIPSPPAIVISDFPIVARAVRSVLDGRYDVAVMSWKQYRAGPRQSAQLVVLDVTSVSLDAALPGLTRGIAPMRVAVCSLHRNEVTVYQLDDEGLTRAAELPNLLALSA
jgi:hypothetical protein